LDILYRWLLLHWLNCPLKAQAAKSKLQQLAFAGSRGVCIPSTQITNISQSFLEFCEAHDWSIVVKAIYTGNVDGMDAGIPTTRVERPTAEQFSGRVALCPTQAQRNIPKSFEVRATVIGRKVFAVSIDSQSHEATRTDWRPFSELCRHDPISLPEDIAAFCVDFLEEFGLSYGAFDFIVSDSGEYTFLECNPFGQYLWTEYETGLEITQAILDHLVGLVGREHPFSETQRL
jgi:glutathione synthase/RimK-type ligase-like ATP-grasp enzyme